MIELRASGCTLLKLCPSSHLELKEPVRFSTPESRKGTNIHRLIAEQFRTGEMPEWGTGEERMLAGRFWRGWPDISHLFPEPLIEEPMALRGDGWVLEGHPDIAQARAAVADIKSGWKDFDYSGQMEGYGLLVDARTAFIIWLRLNAMDKLALPPGDEIADQITERVQAIGKRYNPGSHCNWCPRQNVCEAKRDYEKTVFGALVPLGDGLLPAKADVLKLYEKLTVARQLLNRADLYIKGFIDKEGPLPYGDGTALGYQSYTTRNIDPQKAWPILLQSVSEEQLAKSVRIVKDNIEGFVKFNAPRGEKQKRVAQLWKKLDAADAVERKEHRKLGKLTVEEAKSE